MKLSLLFIALLLLLTVARLSASSNFDYTDIEIDEEESKKDDVKYVEIKKSNVDSTSKPTEKPVEKNTVKPTSAPTSAPTDKPTSAPTSAPTSKPSSAPTSSPAIVESPCLAGTFYVASVQHCYACPDGLSSNDGAVTCIDPKLLPVIVKPTHVPTVVPTSVPTPASAFKPIELSSNIALEAKVCEAGTFYSESVKRCYPCPKGLTSLVGATSCFKPEIKEKINPYAACGSGTFFRDGHCLPCAEGTTSVGGTNECVAIAVSTKSPPKKSDKESQSNHKGRKHHAKKSSGKSARRNHKNKKHSNHNNKSSKKHGTRHHSSRSHSHHNHDNNDDAPIKKHRHHHSSSSHSHHRDDNDDDNDDAPIKKHRRNSHAVKKITHKHRNHDEDYEDDYDNSDDQERRHNRRHSRRHSNRNSNRHSIVKSLLNSSKIIDLKAGGNQKITVSVVSDKPTLINSGTGAVSAIKSIASALSSIVRRQKLLLRK